MGLLGWLQIHWLDFLQSIGIIGGLLFTAITIRTDTKVQRTANVLTLTRQHREIWSQLYDKPELARILENLVDLEKHPVRTNEELFVTFVILHLSGFQEALKQGLLFPPGGVRKDIRDFFSLPIPRTVWERFKVLQDQDFIKFIEQCLEDVSVK